MHAQVWYNTTTVDMMGSDGKMAPQPVGGMLSTTITMRGVALDGNDYCLAWEGDFTEDHDNLYAVAERLWRLFNVVDGTELPMKLGIRSMSVGDVVRLGTDAMNYALVARGFGFELTGDWPN